MTIILQLCLFCGCNKEGSKPCVNNTRYGFNVTGIWSPEHQEYNIGDTIIFSSYFPKKLLNNSSNQEIDYSNSLGVAGNVKFTYLDTSTQNTRQALSEFNVFSIIGEIKPIQNTTNSGITVFFSEQPTLYKAEIGVIFKQKGIFSIAVNDLGSQGLRGKDCTNAGFSITVSNANKHPDLFQYALGYYPDALLLKNIYCFRVR